MTYALLTFLAVFILFATGGSLLFYREAMSQRIKEAIAPQKKPEQKKLTTVIKQTGLSVGQMVGRFEQVLPKSEQEKSVQTQRLVRAGYRNEHALRIFYGCKVICPLLLCAFVAVSGLASLGLFFVYAIALGGGFLAPDFWLGKRIANRQRRITKGLPDLLDLLVICMEAGLSLDQATARAVQEMPQSQPELCDELGMVVLEQRAGRPRSEAWKRMSDRTGVESLRNLVSMLVQTEQFGTSMAKMLRVHADTLRTQRVQMIEEMAAKTTVKLVFPLVIFIFPSLFLVTLGPAAIVMMDSFSTLTGK